MKKLLSLAIAIILTGYRISPIILCGYFPMTRTPFNEAETECPSLPIKKTLPNTNYGYTRAVAMQYAIDKYRQLYNITDLQYKYFAINKRISLYLSDHYACDFLIGPYSSESTQRAMSLFHLLGNDVTFISHGATAHKLSKRKFFPKLLRTVSDDSVDATLLSEIARKFHWTNVATVFTPNYGATSMNNQFTLRMKETRSCVMQIDIDEDVSTYKSSVTEIILQCENNNIKVLFLFLSHNACYAFFKATKYLSDDIKEKLKDIQLVLGSNCGTNIPIDKDVAQYYENMLTVQMHDELTEDFKQYFLKTSNVTGNTSRNFLVQYAWMFHNCCKCAIAPVTPPYEHALIAPVIEAVRVTFKAINYTCLQFEDVCKNGTHSNKIERKKKLRKLLFQYLTNYEERKKNLKIHFKTDGGVTSNFDIFQFQRTTAKETYEYQKVGFWDYLNKNPTERLYLPIFLKSSTCSKPCESNQIFIYNKTSQCCWKCENCSKSQIVTFNKCVLCETGTKPDADQLECRELPVFVMSQTHWLSIVVVVISTGCFLFTIIILIIYAKNYSCKIIKASSRELSLISLAGLILILITPVMFILRPNQVSCACQKFMIGLSLTSCYAPLVLKTNRIYRIFLNSQKFKLKKLFLVSTMSQLSMVAGMLGIQLVLSTFYVMNDGIKPSITYPPNKDYGIERCAVNAASFILNIIFPLILMVASTYWAFKTRNLPTTFSEIKSIGVTMYITLVICMISSALVFVFSGQEGIKFLFSNYYVLCFAYQSIAITTLIGQYAMKVKMIYGASDIQKLAVDTTNFTSINTSKYGINSPNLSEAENSKSSNNRSISEKRKTDSSISTSMSNKEYILSPKHEIKSIQY